MRGLVFLLVVAGFTPAHAALLRPFTEIAGTTVHLGDLFADLGATPDRVLGPAPQPGARIIVQAPQLAAIARDFAVDWRPNSGAEQSVIARRGTRLAQDIVISVLRAALEEAGAPPGADITIANTDLPLLPEGVVGRAQTSETSYEIASGRFTTLLSVSAPDMPTIDMRLSGLAIPMLDGAVLTHRLSLGRIVEQGDVVPARVRAALLHGNPAAKISQVIGMQMRHDIPPGQPLTTADLMRPIVIARGAGVRMTLDAAGIALSAQGVAEEAGGIGEKISVLNPASHVTVQAEITGPGEVTVSPSLGVLHMASVP